MDGTPPPPAAALPAISAVTGIAATVKVLAFEPGLYALTVHPAGADRDHAAGMALPCTSLAGMPASGAEPVELLAAAASPGWFGPDGGTVAVKVPAAGGRVFITTYRLEARAVVPLQIQVGRIDRVRPPVAVSAATPPPPPAEPTRTVAAEIVVHVAELGASTVAGGQWAGQRGRKQPIEAFSLRPLDGIAPTDLEYKAFGPSGRETPWVPGGALCGSRGRGMPLTGLAVRLRPALRERFAVSYEAAFFDAGAIPARSDGEPCRSPHTDDPLEAMCIRMTERLLPAEARAAQAAASLAAEAPGVAVPAGAAEPASEAAPASDADAASERETRSEADPPEDAPASGAKPARKTKASDKAKPATKVKPGRGSKPVAAAKPATVAPVAPARVLPRRARATP